MLMLNSMLLNNQCLTEEIIEEMEKYLQTNESERTMIESVVAQW